MASGWNDGDGPLRTTAPGRGHDRLMLVVKVAAIVVLTAIGIGFLVAAANSGGGDDDAEVTVPEVPPVPEPREPVDPVPTTTAPTPTTTVAVPTVGTQTTVIAPKPTPTSRPAPPRPADEGPIARLNQPCTPEGTYAVNSNGFEPMVCRNGRWARLF
jgi:hypothetical protein